MTLQHRHSIISQGNEKLDAKSEQILSQLDSFDFNIFDLREHTRGNELVTSLCYLLQKENLYKSLSLNPETVKRFFLRIQGEYKPEV